MPVSAAWPELCLLGQAAGVRAVELRPRELASTRMLLRSLLKQVCSPAYVLLLLLCCCSLVHSHQASLATWE